MVGTSKGLIPERAVVFQSPNLFPWLTAKENVAIGVDKVYPKASRAERQDVIEYYLERVGLADSMDKNAASPVQRDEATRWNRSCFCVVA